jgi:biotin carboxyl carrier protein
MSEHEPFQRLIVDEASYQTRLTRKYRRRKLFTAADPRRVAAFIPGVICKVFVAPGKKVRRGEPLLILDAMKMQNTIPAPHDGVIKSVAVKPADKVAKDQLLVEFE